jgi:hypothetical protein
MADRLISCIRTQKPGHSDYIVIYPKGDSVEVTIFGSMAEIEGGIRNSLESVHVGQSLEFEFVDEPFDQLF